MQRRGHKMGAVFSTAELQSLGACFSEHRFLPHGPAVHSSLKSALLFLYLLSHFSLCPPHFLFCLDLLLRFGAFTKTFHHLVSSSSFSLCWSLVLITHTRSSFTVGGVCTFLPIPIPPSPHFYTKARVIISTAQNALI